MAKRCLRGQINAKAAHRRTLHRMRPILIFLVAATLLAGGSAHAQWQWLDKSGHKVFSDQPPPNDIPVRNILKQPGKAATASVQLTPAAANPPGVAASATAGPQAPALVLSQDDKTLQARKAKAEAEAQVKVKADEQAKAQVNDTNCDKARKNLALMGSGARVSVNKTSGERVILDDEGRAAEKKKIQTVIEENCN